MSRAGHKIGRRFGVPIAALAALALAVVFFAQPVAGKADRGDEPNLPGGLSFVQSVHSAADIAGKPSRFKWLLKKIAGIDDRRLVMMAPYGIAVDSRGRMIVADTKARALHIFDPSRHKYKRIDAPGRDQFASPIGVAVDGQDNIYVSDSIRSRIFVFNSDGKYQRAIGALDKDESIFKRSTGIAIDAQRARLYVVDTIAMQIVALTLDGKVTGRYGQRGDQPGQFNYPTQITVAPDGSLWVTDSLNFRVQHLTAEGKPLTWFGRLGDSIGEFDKAKGIAVNRAGDLFVVEGMRDRVQVYTPDGKLKYFFGTTGARNGQFYLPTAITIDGNDRVYVADSYNRRVEIFQLGDAGTSGQGGAR